MTSALSRRLDARRAILEAHQNRPDLVRYVDQAPQMVATSAGYRDGVLVYGAEVHVDAELVPEGNLRLATLTGIGDAIWARGVVRETIKAGLKVWMDTPFKWAFWDMVGTPGFQFWDDANRPAAYAHRTATYLGQDLSDATVYSSMCRRCAVPRGDFRLPIHPSWAQAADELLAKIKPTKPILVARPLLKNHGRRSVTSRNPDIAAYSAIYGAIRSRFHVISVASSSGEDVVYAPPADTVFHKGELPIETVVGLMSKAMVYTNPGMALVVAAGIGAPVIGVFGGYEDAHNYKDTVVYGPSLLLEPIKPCRCMSDSHDCDKRMDLPAAIKRAREFCGWPS